jgi:hypothetical protein
MSTQLPEDTQEAKHAPIEVKPEIETINFQARLWKEYVLTVTEIQIDLIKSLTSIPHGPACHPNSLLEIGALVTDGEAVIRAYRQEKEKYISTYLDSTRGSEIETPEFVRTMCASAQAEAKRLVLMRLEEFLQTGLSGSSGRS